MSSEERIRSAFVKGVNGERSFCSLRQFYFYSQNRHLVKTFALLTPKIFQISSFYSLDCSMRAERTPVKKKKCREYFCFLSGF